MNVTCQCGRQYEIRPEHSGRQFTCNVCGSTFSDQPPVARRHLPMAGRPAFRKKPTPFRVPCVAINLGLIVGGIFVWGSTIGSPPSLWVALHYLSLMAAIIGVVRTCAEKWAAYRGWIVAGGSVAGLCLIVWYGQHDSYREVWVDNDGTSFHDTYSRGGRLKYRYVFLKGGDSMDGAFAGEGKPRQHGKWDYWFGDNMTHVWYWYGEEISEGEWHLRNR